MTVMLRLLFLLRSCPVLRLLAAQLFSAGVAGRGAVGNGRQFPTVCLTRTETEPGLARISERIVLEVEL